MAGVFRSILLFVICFFSVIFGGLFFIFNNQRIDFSVLEHYNPGKPSIVLDDEGKEWSRFSLDRREPITLHEMPEHLKQAFIAAEDHYFWSHEGISWKGIIRSLLVNVYHGRIVQGASTITQQLVKLLFFDSRKTFIRKLKEQGYALLIERQFSKEHILQTYLNHVYFGCGIYGVEAASQRFWGKHAAELSCHESAVLAAIVKSPGSYCPLLFPLSAQKRRNLVLCSMMNLGFITERQFQESVAENISLIEQSGAAFAPHLKETLRVFLENMFGKEKLYGGGLTIATTLNQEIQKKAQDHFNQNMVDIKNRISPEVDGALLCMNSKTGEIKALIGGADFFTSQLNRVFQAKRQFGSIFKTLVYTAAIESGKLFSDTEIDEPLCIQDGNQKWEPRNSSRTFDGQMTLARALSRSNNIITIKTLLSVGAGAVIDVAKRFRISDTLAPYPSLALGCVDGTLQEAVGMFNVFANDGIYVEPHYIKWVKNELGTKIWKKKVQKDRIISSQVSGQVAKILSIGMERMRERYPSEWIDCESIGKTGTTNDSRTCWFCGATPIYITGLYIGCDNNQSMGKNTYAASTAFPIWLGLQRSLKHGKKTFSYDPSLKEICIDSRTGQRCADNNKPSTFSILVPELLV
jgi:penicillin-binding protein 1A